MNTGPVVVGNVGADAQRSFSAIGDTTNVAARLQTMSTPGHITIAERTHADARAIAGVEVEAFPLGPVDLKGKAEPMEAFELLSVSLGSPRRTIGAAVTPDEKVFDSPKGWVARHVKGYVRSDGKRGHRWHGVDTLVLTTRGRCSGKLRRTA